MSPRATLVAALVLCATSCGTTREVQGTPLPLDDPQAAVEDARWERLTAGDVVRVAVFGHPELSTRPEGNRVDADGALQLPLVGPVLVAGLSVQDARTTIADEVATVVREPGVEVSIVTYGPRDLYVLGEVAAPGRFTLDRAMNVSQALALGGKLLSGADRENVVLLRPGPEGFAFHRFDARRPSPAWLVRVRPDDVLFVPRGGHGTFVDEVLPYLQGIGQLTAVPLTFTQFD